MPYCASSRFRYSQQGGNPGRRQVITNYRYVGLALAVAAAPVLAHDFWLQPQRFQVEPGVPLAATFQIGHGANRQRWGNGVERIVLLEAISKGGRSDRRKDVRNGGPADLVTTFATAGLHVLAMQTTTALSDLPAIRFNDYAKAEGLVPILAARQRAGTLSTNGRERYSRRAKALIEVGKQDAASDAMATQAIGLKLEIVPERNPYNLGGTRTLPVHVIYRGRRLANATVKLTNLEFDARPLATATTDKAGRATFEIPAVGDYLLNVIWAEPVSGDPQADFDTTFSSLTFGSNRQLRSR